MQASLNFLSKTTITRQSSAESIIKLLLKNRHITNSKNFLNPSFPEAFPSPLKASKLIKKFLDSQGNILIYGDYDVDGLTSTAILWQALYPLSKNVFPFIPHREKDGYGFKSKSFFRIESEKNLKFDLLITVDNGIVADSEFAKIKAKNPDIKIVVVDHHLPSKKLLHVDAILHSVDTSASVLAWILAREFTPNANLGLAALGLVADCQPIVENNRSVVVHGLVDMQKKPSPGIKKLMDISGVKNETLSVYDLGFLLGPRLNAAGRLSDPTDSLRLLCSQTSPQATKYASLLNTHNRKRQELQKESLDIADKNIDLKNKIVFVAGDFNPGVIGLIAGRLTEKYSLPSVIISTKDDVAKGSCRSIPEVNIIKVLRKYSPLFVDLGGHPGAAGFSILEKNIKRLQKKLNTYFSKKLTDYIPQKEINIDCKMELSAVTLKNITTIDRLSPFGIGNPQPLFYFESLKINSLKLLGQNKDHLKLNLDGIDAIAFKKAELSKDLKIGDSINLVAQLSANTWNGRTTPQLIVKEIYINLK